MGCGGGACWHREWRRAWVSARSVPDAEACEHRDSIERWWRAPRAATLADSSGHRSGFGPGEGALVSRDRARCWFRNFRDRSILSRTHSILHERTAKIPLGQERVV